MNRGAMFLAPDKSPNTFIGGIGGTYTNETEMATIMNGASSSDIVNFFIDVNNNISFRIDTNYELINDVFKNNLDITYYEDRGGHCNRFGSASFQGCTSLMYIIFNASFINNPLSGQFTGCTSLTTVVLPLFQYTSLGFQGCSSLKYYYTPLRTGINDNGGFIGCTLLQYMGGENYNAVAANNFFNNGTATIIMDFPNVTSLSSVQEFRNCGGTKLIFNNMVYINSNSISFNAKLRTLVLPRLSDLGGRTNLTNCFQGSKTNGTIYIDPSTQTNFLAEGSITINTPIDGDQVTLDGRTYTAVTGVPVDNTEFQINPQFGTVTNLRNAIINDVRPTTSGGGFAEIYQGGFTIFFQTDITGTLGNNVLLSSANPTRLTVSGTNLTGGGGRDGDIAYIEDILSWTVIYVTDLTPPNSVNDLTSSNETSISFDLNFTTPISTNIIDHYDVYIDYQDYRGFIMIEGSDEIFITGDTVTIEAGYSGQNIKVKVRTIDEFYNRSEFSNEITVLIP